MTGARTSYHEAVEWLYQLNWFGARFGLETPRRLAELAGNPHVKLRFIHVAGTNGKGSTCAMLEAIYRASGLRVGLFTSPHLVSFRERLQVNRQWISRESVVRLVNELRPLVQQFPEEDHPTFFETVAVMALRYFAEQRVDLVIWETGLGGRLDATSIVTPIASVITNVQLDHQKWLGETLAQIAAEKAGIIKSGVPVISGVSASEAAAVVERVAAENDSQIFKVPSWREAATGFGEVQLSLLGDHQFQNAMVALTVVKALQSQIAVSADAVRTALSQVHWPGRCQLITVSDGRRVLLDGAHNIAGAEALAQTLASLRDSAFAESAAVADRRSRPVLILGVLQDKDWDDICRILAPTANRILLVPVQNERTARPETLVKACRAANPDAEVRCCGELRDAWELCGGEKFIAITGSLYLIGEAMQVLRLAPEDADDERGLNEWSMTSAAVDSSPADGPDAGATIGVRSSKSSIQAITFDVGGTLIEPWPSVGAIYAEVAARHGFHNFTPEQLSRGFRAAWKNHSAFNYSRRGWELLVNQTFGCAADERLPFFEELYERFAEPEAWRVFDDVIPILDQLASAGVRMAVISNWDERLRGLLERLKLSRYFETLAISCEVGFPKPSPVIFQHAADKLGLASANILHVGDSAEHDVAGARSAGLAALHLRRGHQGSSANEIQSLTEVLKFAGADKGT